MENEVATLCSLIASHSQKSWTTQKKWDAIYYKKKAPIPCGMGAMQKLPSF